MFRRFADRLSAAVNGGDNNEKVRILQNMGFDANQARSALETTGGDVHRAAELLLQSGPPAAAATPRNNDDVAMYNALKESMQSEEQRRYKEAQEASIQQKQAPVRSAASSRAGQAAASRASGGTTTTSRKNNRSPIQAHPNVKVPTRLEDKTKEEQILRNVDRVKGHPAAVDTLYRALTALRNDPSNAKFQRIDKTTKGYQRSLANAPGAEALLLTCNFMSRGTTLELDRSRGVDPALLYLAVSALDEIKKSPEYEEAKRKEQFVKEISNIQLRAESSVEEAIQRANFISKCPSEPSSGAGALIQVTFGSTDNIIRRRFDGDDVLRDVIHWLCGNFGSVVQEKLVSREWCIVDMNRYPVAPIDCEVNMDKTLQYVGFWPSGKLDIRPSPASWSSNSDDEMLDMGSSRGLGAAPSDVLRR